MKLKLRFPEIAIGIFLTVAIFAMGMVFESSNGPLPKQPPRAYAAQENSAHPPGGGFWHWLTHDAAGFFTLWLVIVGGGQIVLFYWQLRLIRKTLGPAQVAAEAAKESADALVAAEAARLLIYPKSNSLYDSVVKFGVIWDKSPEMGNLSSRPGAVFVLKNYGKTPATLMGADVFLRCHEGEPPTIDGSGSSVELPLETVIASGSFTPELIVGVENTLTMQDAIDIAGAKKSIWLYGTITYSDVFERICDQKFLFRLHPTNGSFIRYYDRSTYRKPKHYEAGIGRHE